MAKQKTTNQPTLYFINQHMEWLTTAPNEATLTDDPAEPDKYMPATAEQQAFKLANPDATTDETRAMAMASPAADN